jgi:FkbM family methyltransferase
MTKPGGATLPPARRLAKRLARRLAMAFGRFCVPSYAQEGEDRVLWRLFGDEQKGFYVDVGAHHPMRFSNTYLFYREGWSGITIDADPKAAELFARVRPRDIHVTVGVSDAPGILTYHRFDESALNTFDPVLAEERARLGTYRPLPPIAVEVTPLSHILAAHLPAGREITFLSVDVEGYDVKVLRSNDWKAFRPRFVLAESLGASLATLASDGCCAFLRSVGYEPFAKTVNTVFYLRADLAS